jgi:putative lipoic acid-binding regulatory protein
MTEASLLDFPCELPVKVLGRNDAVFRQAAWRIVRNHYAEIGESHVSEQQSRQNSYLSLTFIVHAQSRDEIDALYRELSASAEVMLVL